MSALPIFSIIVYSVIVMKWCMCGMNILRAGADPCDLWSNKKIYIYCEINLYSFHTVPMIRLSLWPVWTCTTPSMSIWVCRKRTSTTLQLLLTTFILKMNLPSAKLSPWILKVLFSKNPCNMVSLYTYIYLLFSGNVPRQDGRLRNKVVYKWHFLRYSLFFMCTVV